MTGIAPLNVGFDNIVNAERIIAIASSNPLPMKRLREAAVRTRKLVDATNGRRTRALIVTDSDHVILSSLQPQTLVQRLHELRGGSRSSGDRERS
jgi:regulator of extracellular matrix RemA (YlzA/DUF370 family)